MNLPPVKPPFHLSFEIQTDVSERTQSFKMEISLQRGAGKKKKKSEKAGLEKASSGSQRTVGKKSTR